MICPNCKSNYFKGCGDVPYTNGDGLTCASCGWKKEEYVPSVDKKIWHPKDIEYYYEYPAPLHENMQRMHFTNVNSTIPFFSAMLYYFARQVGAEQILEIGTAEGYTSFHLAHAVKDNATRFCMKGNHFYGIDIVQIDSVRERLLRDNLPVTLLTKDSMTLSKDTFPGLIFDIIWQDGNHDKEHVLYEFETMWPQLKGGGNGYWIAHDCYGPAEEGCKLLIEKIKNENIPVEYIRFGGMYGLLIIRKMEGYDESKWKWSD